MDWASAEFFQRGAFLTDRRDGSLLLAKGGEVKEISELPRITSGRFFLKDFYSSSLLEYHPSEMRRMKASEFELPAVPVPFENLQDEEETYEKDFRSLQSSFGHSLEKVVLISRKSYLPKDFLEAKKKMIAKAIHFGEGISYGIWTEDFGIAGATPEILFEISGLDLKTFALAGTAPKDQAEALLRSAKDIHEHQLVIKNISEVLGEFATEIHRGETFAQPYRNLVHLRTDLSVKLKGKSLESEILTRLSPTAALGGYPKENALKFLQNSEYGRKFPKRIFGSAFGFIEEDYTEFVVMIRNIQWNQSEFFIESGGGVVQESELSREIEELRLKRGVIEEYYL